ncbi:MAG: hypothetical protein ACK4VI_06065 [Alphaproteobacteria bacterium]
MNRLLNGFAAAAMSAAVASASIANAQDVSSDNNTARQPNSVVVDPVMNTDLFIFENQRSGNAITVYRSSYDHAAEVVCEWEAEAVITDQKIGDVTLNFLNCGASDAPVWAGQPRELSLNDVFVNPRHDLLFDLDSQLVTELSQNGPNGLDVVSEYRREWDFVSGRVCLSASEGLVNEAPYLEQDKGCYNIPDNDHTRDLRLILDIQ